MTLNTKMLSTTLTLGMALSVILSGCGNGSDNTPSTPASAAVSAAPSSSPAAEAVVASSAPASAHSGSLISPEDLRKIVMTEIGIFISATKSGDPSAWGALDPKDYPDAIRKKTSDLDVSDSEKQKFMQIADWMEQNELDKIEQMFEELGGKDAMLPQSSASESLTLSSGEAKHLSIALSTAKIYVNAVTEVNVDNRAAMVGLIDDSIQQLPSALEDSLTLLAGAIANDDKSEASELLDELLSEYGDQVQLIE